MTAGLSGLLTCYDADGNRYEVPIIEITWRPAAYGIILKDEHVLLCRQSNNKYDLPGGGVNIGEDPKATVIREVMEETNIAVDDPILLGMESSMFHAINGDGKSYHSILLYFVCSYVGGEPSIKNLDSEIEKMLVQKAEWVPLRSIDEIGVASTVDFRSYVKKACFSSG